MEVLVLPDRRSTPSVPDDERDLRNYLHAEFKVPQDDCTLEYKTDGESTKYSTEHDEMRYYDYRIYRGVVSARRILGLLTGRSTSAVIVASG